MQTLKVDLGERSYPIHIGEGLLDQPELLAPHIAGRQVAIISNETVAPLYLERLTRSLSAFSVISVVLPDGEAFKNWETLQLIFDGLLTARHDRRTTVVALGGGVIGDMAGFAAACYQRGVDFIQIPTTLLSQVDSSVGGKTGINHPLGKNMVGAFYQPNVVLIDTATLNTLPARELSAGLAEVIKYGLICDEPFLGWLEENVDRLRALDQAALTYAIERSCAAKAAVVGADERESGCAPPSTWVTPLAMPSKPTWAMVSGCTVKRLRPVRSWPWRCLRAWAGSANRSVIAVFVCSSAPGCRWFRPRK